MSSAAESLPLSQSSVGSKARRVSRRGQIWSNFREEIDATGWFSSIHLWQALFRIIEVRASRTKSTSSEVKKIRHHLDAENKEKEIQEALTSALAILGYLISMLRNGVKQKKAYGKLNGYLMHQQSKAPMVLKHLWICATRACHGTAESIFGESNGLVERKSHDRCTQSPMAVVIKKKMTAVKRKAVESLATSTQAILSTAKNSS
uniref:Uncharacterized protein n=1 Tax=Ditylenchus dipsaci TaxID=166011 RepID=A0A915CMJ8_9BILA